MTAGYRRTLLLASLPRPLATMGLDSGDQGCLGASLAATMPAPTTTALEAR